MGNKTKYLTIFFILCLCLFATTIFVNKNNCVLAFNNYEFLTTREAFSTALSKKQSVIFVGDINFGETPISIDLTYSVEIIGNSEKALFLNAHFNIVGGTTESDFVKVTFKNINFNGTFDTQSIVLENGKTFAENFNTERTNPVYKAIVPTGLFELQIDNCEFYNYASKSGAIIYRLNGDSSSIYSSILISNTKIHNIICEESPLYIVDKSLNLKIINSDFYNNTTQFCAGVSIFGAKAELDGVNIHDNNFLNFCSVFDKYSGGLFAASCNIVVKNSNFVNNSSFNGGGVQLTNTNAIFYNCKILNNKVFKTGTSKAGILYCEGGYGGGVFVVSNEGQIVKFENCNISANSAVNGGAIAVMPAYQNAKGGRVELLFCNIGLNSQEDGEAIKYYGYSEQNKGVLLVKGSIIIDDTSLQNAEEDYNFISTKSQALLNKVINNSIIEEANTNGLIVLSGSIADRYVPNKVCRTWSLYSFPKGDRKIGTIENVDSSINIFIILLPTIISLLLIVGVVCVILILKRNKKLKPVHISDVTKPKIDNSNVIKSDTFTNENINVILNNIILEVSLSKKEIEVLKLALLGKQRKAIASECYVTEHTIKKHLASIYDKLGVGTRKELYKKAKQYLN